MREYPFITLNMTKYGDIYLTTYSEHYKTFNLLDTEGKRVGKEVGGGSVGPQLVYFFFFFLFCYIFSGKGTYVYVLF